MSGLWGYSVSLMTEVIADKYDNENVCQPCVIIGVVGLQGDLTDGGIASNELVAWFHMPTSST